jgi:hypothetical protein
MKTLNITLALVLMLAASMNAVALFCNNPGDCRSLDEYASDSYCKGTAIYDDYTTYYACTSHTCVISSPGERLYVDCAWGLPNICLNGDLYSVINTCDGGACEINSKTLSAHTSPSCDSCKKCAGMAHDLSSPLSDVTYTRNFDNDYGDEVAMDNGVYVVPPDTTMSLTDISTIYYFCGNGVPVPRVASLIAWVYNTSSNKKISMAYNNLEIDSGLNREDVIGSSSTTCGTLVLNAFEMLFEYGMSNEEIEDIYNFVKPSNYTVYIDLISGYCGPNDVYNSQLTQNYVCPWLGGSHRANVCSYFGRNVEGWTPKQNLKVLVPNPDVTITAPPSEANLNVTTIQKTWVINNTGLGRSSISITYDCGTWTCAFDSYAQGSPIPLNEKGVYPITLDITTDPTELTSHQVGIIVSYDDGYGLKGIPPKTKTSYISLASTNAITTTSSTTTTQGDNYVT